MYNAENTKMRLIKLEKGKQYKYKDVSNYADKVAIIWETDSGNKQTCFVGKGSEYVS